VGFPEFLMPTEENDQSVSADLRTFISILNSLNLNNETTNLMMPIHAGIVDTRHPRVGSGREDSNVPRNVLDQTTSHENQQNCLAGDNQQKSAILYNLLLYIKIAT
jgi:hypothetical protein